LEGIYHRIAGYENGLQATVRDDYRFSDPILQNLDFHNKKILLLTTHRRENLGGPLSQVYLALKRIISEHPEVEIVFPVHKNPKVRQVVEEVLGEVPRVHMIEPLDYQPFINLMQKSYMVLTDSGGLQEEAPSLGKPVLVLRDTTERPEALAAGTVRLVGTNSEEVYQHAKELITSSEAYQGMANAVNPYGDGKASARIVNCILYYFGRVGVKPENFM
ncbi:MAG: UDP-N-acetylglucosamine 2-epimerase (non-hydrolyzing), partial [Bacillota bacterium]|nr:UDP-N-acetylglucosamine 2-epimerase (non-hydrolyzing) [Bacillota bacterium]